MPVYQDSGPSLGEGLVNAFQAFAQGRRQRRQDDIFEQEMADRMQARKLKEIELAQSGVHLLDPKDPIGSALPFKAIANDITDRIQLPAMRGAEAPQFDPVNGGVVPKSRAAVGAVNIPGKSPSMGMTASPSAAPASANDPTQMFRSLMANMGAPIDRGPRFETGPGYYIDNKPKWDAQDTATNSAHAAKLFEATIQSALADAAMGRDVNKERLIAPIRTEQAVNAERALSPIRTEQAVNTETALSPLRTAQTIATARATLPIEVQKAVAIENGTLPGKLALAQATAGGQKPTDFSNRAALVAPRAEQAAKVLDAYFTRGAPTASILGHVPLVGNYLQGDDAQRMNQAAETVASAILRLESGASISEGEIKSMAKQLLPQPGDSPAVLQQKRETLSTQMSRLHAAAAPSMGGSSTAGAGVPASPTAPVVAPRPNGDSGNIDLRAPHVQTIDEMIKAGKSDAEIKAALAGRKP